MSDLKTAIDGFLAGKTSAADLDRLLPREAGAGEGLLDQLELRAQRGEISRDAVTSVSVKLGGQTHAPGGAPSGTGVGESAPGDAGAPDDADQTRIRSPGTAPAATGGSDWQQRRTVQSAGPSATAPTTAGTQPSGTVAWYGEARPVAPGAVLRGRFVLESVLGSGGMGTVFKARDLRKEEARDRNPYVAVKVLGQEFRQHPDAFLALQREARKSQSLAHPNIVTVYDFDRDGPTVFMTMEFLDGTPLDAVIRQHRAAGGMALADCRHIVEGVCRALSYAHEKSIVHADFKPGNVFITRDDTVKVLDFGIARVFERPGVRSDTTYFDVASLEALTYSYASCEMLEGADPDPRDDIYALGCVVFELLTGHHPFRRVKATDARANGIKPRRIPGLNRRQWKALCDTLAFDRDRRTPDVGTFFEAFLGDGGARPRKLAMTLTAAVVVAVLGVVAGLSLTGGDPALDSLPADTFVAPQINADQADVLLEQAEYYLDMTAEDFDADLLTEGVSNANDALRTVLSLQPANERALAARREIAARYAIQAKQLLEAGDDNGARRLTVIGLSKVQRDNRDLQRLYRRLGPPKTGS